MDNVGIAVDASGNVIMVIMVIGVAVVAVVASFGA